MPFNTLFSGEETISWMQSVSDGQESGQKTSQFYKYTYTCMHTILNFLILCYLYYRNEHLRKNMCCKSQGEISKYWRHRCSCGNQAWSYGKIKSNESFRFLLPIHTHTHTHTHTRKSLSRVRLFATPWSVAPQAPRSMGFSRHEYCSGLPFPSPGDLPDPGIEPGLPHCRQTLYRLSHLVCR